MHSKHLHFFKTSSFQQITGFIFACVLSASATGQNLVPNPSFETANCPTGYNGAPTQVAMYIPSWYSANCASPDPMTDCSSYANTSVPDVWFGHTYAHSGNNYMGMGFYGGWYEYIGTQLTQPLTAGTTYNVSFFVRCAQQAKYATDGLGIYFSTTQIICTSGFSGPVLPYTPQVIQTPGTFLNDTSGWVEVTGTYTATGGEEFLVLGYFNAWNVASFMDIGGSAARCYYYWDDIKVEEAIAIPNQPAAINGNANICAGTIQTYAVSPVPGATGYTWTLPPGWTGSSITHSITVTAGATGGNITVTADNGSGSSAPQTIAVTVNTVPAAPDTIHGDISVCPNNTEIYTIDPSAGADTYQWTLPAGWAGTSDSTSIYSTTTNNSGSVSVIAINSCGNSAPFILAVTVVQVNDSISLNAGTLTAYETPADYQWVDCNNGYAAILGEDQPSFTPLISGNYAVVITKNGCTDTSVCTTVSVQPVGVETEGGNGSFYTVYPNPAHAFVSVVSSTGFLEGSMIQLVDVTGKVLQVKRAGGAAAVVFPLEEVEAGMYFIRILHGTNTDTYKITVVK